jgi:hypothetical protein
MYRENDRPKDTGKEGVREDGLGRELRRPLNRHPAEAVGDEGDSSDGSIKPKIPLSLPGHRHHRTEERVFPVTKVLDELFFSPFVNI